MKKLLRAVVAFAALSAAGFVAVPAGAADMPPSMPPPRAPASYVPFFSWSGPYVGINFGYGLGSSNWTSAVATTGTFKANGGVVGGTAGYNWQSGSIVFGAETDFDWSGIHGSSTAVACGTTCDTKNSWLGTLRGRLGYAWWENRVMSYFTGGLAFGNVKISDGGVSASSTRTGWALGGGGEMSFGGGWTGKLEYLYVDLGTATCDTTCSGGALPFDVKFKTNLIRGGVNYKF